MAAEEIVHPESGKILVKRGSLIEESASEAIEEAGVQTVAIRSPLTCEAEEGVCTLCYGRDLARGTLVNVGEAVGIIAAQSIGEPGTQLTMRTFHVGGIAEAARQSSVEANHNGKVEFRHANVLKNSKDDQLVVGRNMQLAVLDRAGRELAVHNLAYGARLLVADGQAIARGDKLFEWDPYTLPIIAEQSGVARHVDLVPA